MRSIPHAGFEDRFAQGNGGEKKNIEMSVFIFPFEKLEVWQLARDLAGYVLGLLEKIPSSKHMRLVSQMEGAVTSVSQNIAEGKGRQYKKEFIQFLYISEGSIFEVVTLNEIFRGRNIFLAEESQEIRKRCEEIDRKLNGLIRTLKGNRKESKTAG